MSVVARASAHIPVLCDEVVQWLTEPRSREKNEKIVDATVGAGGHARALLQAMPHAHLLGIDRDREILSIAEHELAVWRKRVTLKHGRFRDLADHVQAVGWKTVDGIVADLGVSSLQLDRSERGFSFRGEGQLDMRMDQGEGESAADWLATVTEEEMADVFFQYGEEHRSRPIARHLCRRRSERPFLTTADLAQEIERVVPRRGRLHPATKVFQAIRIRLNEELEELTALLREAPLLLAPGGRLVMLSYHSLEDRMVKQTFRRLQGEGFSLPVKRAVQASRQEIETNPRARSAKLRVLERVGT